MKQQDFLRYGTALGVSAAIGSTLPVRAAAGETVIVGAGMAGLAAAGKLQAHRGTR